MSKEAKRDRFKSEHTIQKVDEEAVGGVKFAIPPRICMGMRGLSPRHHPGQIGKTRARESDMTTQMSLLHRSHTSLTLVLLLLRPSSCLCIARGLIDLSYVLHCGGENTERV